MSAFLLDQKKISRLINYCSDLFPNGLSGFCSYLNFDTRNQIEKMKLEKNLSIKEIFHHLICEANYQAVNGRYNQNDETFSQYQMKITFQNVWEAIKFCDCALYQMSEGENYFKRSGYEIVKRLKQGIIENQKDYISASWG
jgi:hypothetical protein